MHVRPDRTANKCTLHAHIHLHLAFGGKCRANFSLPSNLKCLLILFYLQAEIMLRCMHIRSLLDILGTQFHALTTAYSNAMTHKQFYYLFPSFDVSNISDVENFPYSETLVFLVSQYGLV